MVTGGTTAIMPIALHIAHHHGISTPLDSGLFVVLLWNTIIVGCLLGLKKLDHPRVPLVLGVGSWFLFAMVYYDTISRIQEGLH
jgi:hypothetical protein